MSAVGWGLVAILMFSLSFSVGILSCGCDKNEKI